LTAAITGKGIRRRSTIVGLHAVFEGVDVAARAECPAGAGDDQAAQAGAVGEPREDHRHLENHLRAHRVEGVGPVEGQRPDLPVDLEVERVQLGRAQGLGAHFCALSVSA
jgi:hypothetical protein